MEEVLFHQLEQTIQQAATHRKAQIDAEDARDNALTLNAIPQVSVTQDDTPDCRARNQT